jgi:hypothetical protein
VSTHKACYDHSLKLRTEMESWIDQSKRMDPPSRHGGGEDEANYALAWFPHYLVTGSEGVRQHFEYLRDMLAGWVERDCVHGYEPVAEAHHGTEPFLLFLPRFLGLFPDDQKGAALLDDAAHHIGNWVEGIPDWFDWDRNRFWGYHIGTEEVNRDLNEVKEIAEHFRFIHIALAAHRMSGDQKYLDWSVQYGTRRAQMILDVAEGPLPLAWGPNGEPVYQEQATTNQKNAAQGGHHVTGDPLVGVECLLASGALYALGDLFEATGDEVFRSAARRIVTPLVNEISDPYCDPGAAALSYYRRAFADTGLDDVLHKEVETLGPEEAGELTMMFPEHRKRTWTGVGKRMDMTFWGVWDDKNGNVTGTREPCTAALTLAYQLTGDVDYARRAFSQAERKLTMVRRVLRGGREHADMGGAICSTAAGHGRNWGWGAVTGCYGPLMLGTVEKKGAVVPAVQVESAGEMRIPDDILTLVRPDSDGSSSVSIYNGGDTAHKLTIHTPESLVVDVGPGETLDLKADKA